MRWLSDIWNVVDACAIILFFVAFCFRSCKEYHMTVRAMYAVDIMLWIYRLMDTFKISRHLGPTVVMIKQMVRFIIFANSYLLQNVILGFKFLNDAKSMALGLVCTDIIVIYLKTYRYMHTFIHTFRYMHNLFLSKSILISSMIMARFV